MARLIAKILATAFWKCECMRIQKIMFHPFNELLSKAILYVLDYSRSTLLKMGSRSDNLCVNVATKYTSYICIHGAAVANLCC